MGLIWTNYILQVVADTRTLPFGRNELMLWRAAGGAVGAFVAFAVLFGIRFVTQELYERLFPVFIAIAFSMMMGYFLARYIMLIMPPDAEDIYTHVYLTSTLVLLFGFIGISLGLTKASNWESLVSAVKRQELTFANPKILDTSAIIDGRLAEIVNCGFVEGTLVVPRFVLSELQHVADSSELVRRTKGRRGLDILRDLQESSSGIRVEIIEDDPGDRQSVDAKLVALARQFNAKIITTDFNLNKVAQIEGIRVLNMNDLANALKPAALPNEVLAVHIVKEGKEAGQGVGYLPDGTMIVVDHGRDVIGQDVDVVVTSVLQTNAGRMIFAKLPEHATPPPARAGAK
jgi:uncharacterized protein YacL